MKGLNYSLSVIIVSIVCVFGAIAGLSVFTADVITNYPTDAVNMTNFSVINRMNQTWNMTQTVNEDIQSATETPILAPYYAIKGGWDALLSMVSVVDIFSETVTEVSNTTTGFVIPDWFKMMIYIVITLIIIFTLLAFMGKVNL